MAYHVSITARAERDLAELYEHVHAEESLRAKAWYFGLREAILSLRSMPGRCSKTPENRDLKHLLCGRKPNVYRVIFRVVEKKREVQILHIRHGA